MKSLLKTIFLFGLLYILSSCNPTIRISEKKSERYKDLKINKKIVIKDDYAYTTTKNGTPVKICLDRYNVEILTKDVKNQKFFSLVEKKD